ncbi:MAG: putative two-component system sensor kinase [Cryobacterium sp.]|nr:putative two-component system sensor kinase [Cryobacterium sp.]
MTMHTNSAPAAPSRRSFLERPIGLARSIWTAPGAVPPPPRRVWRDWVLVAGVVLLAVFEGLVRADLPWTLLSVITLVVLSPTLLWRRTRPLAMFAISFVALGLVTVVTGDSLQLYTSAFLILLPYAVFRWGTGRAITVGTALMLADLGFSTLAGTGFADTLGEVAVVLPVIILGLALRFRANARVRELDRAKSFEREQLARDLHDTVAHHVSAIAIRAQAGLAMAEQKPDAATVALGVIEAEASKTLAEMRSMVRVLRRADSPDLSPSPRIADLEQLAHVEAGAPSVDVHITGDTGSVPPPVGAAVYRLAQESITNARRHARHATRIDVRLHADDERILLSVSDDGEAVPATTPGYGITGMVERATLLGGTCEAGPLPGRGWVVTAVLPRAGWSA